MLQQHKCEKHCLQFFMIIRHLIVIAVLFLSYRSVSGQTSTEQLEKIVWKFVNDQRVKKIDTFCIYQSYCVGCNYKWGNKEDRCDFEGLYIPTYIFWLEKGKTFVVKKDNCFDYAQIRIDNDSLWQFFFPNRDAMEREEIKEPQYVEVKNGREQIYSSRIDHSWHQGIQVIVRQDTIINQEVDEYFFSKEIGFGRHKNINYEYNVNSYIKRFQELLERTSNAVTQSQVLRKTRR
jgi:hypothetical protein